MCNKKVHLNWDGSTFKDFLLAPFIKHFVKMLSLHIRWSLEHTTWKFRGGASRIACLVVFGLGAIMSATVSSMKLEIKFHRLTHIFSV